MRGRVGAWGHYSPHFTKIAQFNVLGSTVYILATLEFTYISDY